MREIGAFEAKNKLGQLLDLVEQGEEITITRHGKEVARLVPARPVRSRDEAPAHARAGRTAQARPIRRVFDAELWSGHVEFIDENGGGPGVRLRKSGHPGPRE